MKTFSVYREDPTIGQYSILWKIFYVAVPFAGLITSFFLPGWNFKTNFIKEQVIHLFRSHLQTYR